MMRVTWHPIYNDVVVREDMMSAAIELASAGWPVFPCVETGKAAKSPYTTNGFKDASTDSAQIEEWWRWHPSAMIGMAILNMLLVLDIDPRNDGSLETLEECLGPLPRTLTVWSGRGDGGRHLYFLRPPGQLTAANLPKGIDLKVGGRGYCIAPPSIHPDSGLPYRWDQAAIASLPPAALAKLRPPPTTSRNRPAMPHVGDGSHLVRWLDNFPETGINNALYWATCCAVENGWIDLIAEQLIDKAVSLGESEDRARRTVESAWDCIVRRSGVRR